MLSPAKAKLRLAEVAGTVAGIAPTVAVVVAALAVGFLLDAVLGPVTLTLQGLRCAGC